MSRGGTYKRNVDSLPKPSTRFRSITPVNVGVSSIPDDLVLHTYLMPYRGIVERFIINYEGEGLLKLVIKVVKDNEENTLLVEIEPGRNVLNHKLLIDAQTILKISVAELNGSFKRFNMYYEHRHNRRS